jgi:hypothetical protein
MTQQLSEGRNTHSNININLGKVGRFGPVRVCSTPESCPACRQEKTIGQIENPFDGIHVLAKFVFGAAPTGPAGASHWFPTGGLGCGPFWLVVSSGAQNL